MDLAASAKVGVHPAIPVGRVLLVAPPHRLKHFRPVPERPPGASAPLVESAAGDARDLAHRPHVELARQRLYDRVLLSHKRSYPVGFPSVSKVRV